MQIIQVYPQYQAYQAIEGIYLGEIAPQAAAPIVYGNFVTSLDGRIALLDGNAAHLPRQLINDNDLRLFLELRTQADCIVTHGGYMRDRAAGKLGDILNIGEKSGHYDLAQWRREHAMPPQPAIVICSHTLDFPLLPKVDSQNVMIATGDGCDKRRRNDWEKQGYRIIEAGRDRVTGGALMPRLFELGFKRIYLCAGPELLESCAADGCLNRLYLTLSMQLLGHSDYLTMIPGLQDLRHFHLQLRRLIVDASPRMTSQQLFAAFDCVAQNVLPKTI